jgi:hypothetical protein
MVTIKILKMISKSFREPISIEEKLGMMVCATCHLRDSRKLK